MSAFHLDSKHSHLRLDIIWTKIRISVRFALTIQFRIMILTVHVTITKWDMLLIALHGIIT